MSSTPILRPHAPDCLCSSVAALLGLSIRFGPHLMWRTVQSNISVGIVPILSKPLVAAPPNDNLVMCKVGPVSVNDHPNGSTHVRRNGASSKWSKRRLEHPWQLGFFTSFFGGVFL